MATSGEICEKVLLGEWAWGGQYEHESFGEKFTRYFPTQGDARCKTLDYNLADKRMNSKERTLKVVHFFSLCRYTSTCQSQTYTVRARTGNSDI